MGELTENFWDKILEEMMNNIQDPNEFSGKIGMSVVLLLLLIGLEWLFHQLWRKIIEDVKTLNIVGTITRFLLRFLFLISLTRLWLNALDTLLIVLIFIGLVLSLAIKGLISNVAGWFLIVNKHHFRMYDRIEIGNVKGEIISVGILYFTLMEISHWFDAEAPTGRTVKIPNSKILTEAVYNYNEMTPFVWKEISYNLAFESNWQLAQKIIAASLLNYYENFEKEYLADELFKKAVMKKMQLFDGELKPVQIVDVTKDGIVLKVRYIVYYTEGTYVATQLHQEILQAFQTEKIEMAGRRIYFTQGENING
ncbi:mechanosensitive ion channel family protein [Enterococcus sp. SMC-9]|uniref:mechanosensitive ion channel family protein n=1 Tax=Enterococcus sp. SMC-9 TaxID=2862343 RepID=UPI001E5F7A0C|nr:mechanosensitive ion channel domain-containing protein [Enterococcus sp. SMC-9]MCD1023892.1 mechanosensitive ion channel family protein [Enterococcus sp. SMC-9]